jgi:hypothetical protein
MGENVWLFKPVGVTPSSVDHGDRFALYKMCLMDDNGPLVVLGELRILGYLGGSRLLGELVLYAFWARISMSITISYVSLQVFF